MFARPGCTDVAQPVDAGAVRQWDNEAVRDRLGHNRGGVRAAGTAAGVVQRGGVPVPAAGQGQHHRVQHVFVEGAHGKLTITLSNNPINGGNGAQASVTIQNTGVRLLRWTNDGCDTHAGVIAIMPAAWRESSLVVSPELAPYRDWLREEARAAEPIRLRFRQPHFLRYRSIGCADLGIGRELAPGRKVTQEFTWDGVAAPRLGLPPSGPVTLTSRFERWTRPGPGSEGEAIEVSLDSWVLRGRPDENLSPAEAIDAALADERLASWLVTRPIRDGADAIAEYDRDLGLWVVGLLMYRDDGQPILHAAFVDAVTGEVITVREHRVEF